MSLVIDILGWALAAISAVLLLGALAFLVVGVLDLVLSLPTGRLGRGRTSVLRLISFMRRDRPERPLRSEEP